MNKAGILCAFLLFCISGASQSTLPLGGWRSHLPYQNGKQVTQSNDKIIYATDWSLVFIDKAEIPSEVFFSKVEGLSDVGIAALEYDDFNDQLLIGYDNSNIDVMSNDVVINLSNIKTNTTILGDRQIYDIHVANERFGYFGTGFGVVQLDVQTMIFGFTAFTGMPVLDITSRGNVLYIATEDGIYSADQSGNLNLGDFNNWTFHGGADGLPEAYSAIAVENYQGQIYAGIDDVLWKERDNGSFDTLYVVDDPTFNIRYLSAEGARLLLGLRDNRFSSRVLFFDHAGAYIENGNFCSDRTLYAIEDQFQRIWYADEWDDIRYSEDYTSQCARVKFETPKSHKVSDIAIKDDVVFVASGGVSDAFGATGSRDGFYILEEGTWTNINESNFPFIQDNNLVSFFSILPHPTKNVLYIGTFWGGLMALNRDDDSAMVYREHNSSLGIAIGDTQRVRISGMAFDRDTNLWISNFGAARPISVLSAAGNWHSFPVSSDTKLADVAIDEDGNKWFVVIGNGGGVFVLVTGANIEDTSDDDDCFFNVGNSAITTNEVHSVAVDLEGDVWVGTSEGPVVFECQGAVFDGDCVGSRRKVLQDSIAAFLLANEVINAITVDGANRKWFGTRNGIFVQSPSGEEQIEHFTVDNSPLFDNNVIELAYNGDSGEVLIATDKGMQAYRSDATEGRSRHSSEVFAFPNPVRPDYDGPIAIKGLARDANVKITDMNGKLVFETTALGSQAIWDGKDYTGRKAQSGVYLVFSSSTDTFDDPDTFVTKILFIH